MEHSTNYRNNDSLTIPRFSFILDFIFIFIYVLSHTNFEFEYNKLPEIIEVKG